MGKVWVVFKREYLERVRSKWFIVATVLGPVFMALIVVLPAVLAVRTKTSTRLADVVILDATGTNLGARVAEALRQRAPQGTGDGPRVRVVTAAEIPAAEDSATQAVIRREAVGYLVLDANTLAGTSMKYAGRNAAALIDIQTLERTVRQAVLAQRLEGEGMNAERVLALTRVQIEARTEKITDRGKEGASGMANFFFAYGIVIVLYMMIAIYGQSILRGVLEEKTSRVAEVVISSVKPDVLLAGKIIGSGMVAVTQVLAWIGMSLLLFQFRAPALALFGAPSTAAAAVQIPSIPPGVALILLTFFVAGFIFYAALFGAVGAMVSNQEDVQQASMPVMLLLVASLIFMQPILLNPSSTLAVTMSVLPFSAPLMMPLRMALITVPWYEIAGALASVVLGCALAIWASARIYRVGLLMYGKRPSVRELVRWIRIA